jgi:hypothetical protein
VSGHRPYGPESSTQSRGCDRPFRALRCAARDRSSIVDKEVIEAIRVEPDAVICADPHRHSTPAL